MTLPGMLSRRAGRRAALCPDHLVCCSVATSNSTTSLAALATATEAPSGVKATAVTVLPSCVDKHTHTVKGMLLSQAMTLACGRDKHVMHPAHSAIGNQI